MADKLIEECRQRFGSPPRQHGFSQRFHLTARPPLRIRCRPRDPLWDFYTQQTQTRTNGQIVWGRIVQANSLMFAPGKSDCPAEVVYSFQDIPGGNVTFLSDLAAVMFQLKGTAQEDRGLADIANHLANETERRSEREVSRRLTAGHEVFSNGIIVVRKHLPGGYLRHNFFPLIVDRRTSFPMILSWRYWPQVLVDAWRL